MVTVGLHVGYMGLEFNATLRDILGDFLVENLLYNIQI